MTQGPFGVKDLLQPDATASEALQQKATIDYRSEVVRKLIHLCSLAIPIIYYFIPKSAALAILVPLLVLGLPLLDTGLPVVRRLYRLGNAGTRASSTLRYVVRNAHVVFLPDRGHVHHQLLDRGLSPRGAVVLLYTVVSMMAGAALSLVLLNSPFLAALLVAVLTGSILLFLLLVRPASRTAPHQRVHRRTTNIDPYREAPHVKPYSPQLPEVLPDRRRHRSGVWHRRNAPRVRGQ